MAQKRQELTAIGRGETAQHRVLDFQDQPPGPFQSSPALRGLTVGRSFARSYVEFATTGIKLALYKHRALAKDAGVSPEGTGSHRIAIISDAGPFTDPDGFAWETAGASNGEHAVAEPASLIPQAS